MVETETCPYSHIKRGRRACASRAESFNLGGAKSTVEGELLKVWEAMG